MHEIYKTKGFVLEARNVGEGNQYLTLFTREKGLVRAVARSVREGRSKLRYSLQSYTYAHISLVQGKEVWRITGAQAISNIFYDLQDRTDAFLILARAFSLLERLLQGEERNEELFTLLEEGMTFLFKHTTDKETLQNFEYVLVLRMLALLGYVGENDKLSELLARAPFEVETLRKASPLRDIALAEINTAIKESQL